MKSKKLRESIAAKLAEVSALQDRCEKESREYTADEKAHVDAAIGVDGKGGEVANLKAQLAQAEAFENEIAALAANRIPGGVHHERAGVEDSSSIFSRVKVPARALARGRITAFAGPDKEKQAYAFGRYVMAICGNQRSQQWCADTIGFDIKNVNTEGSDPEGGFLVPHEFEATLIRLVNEYGVIRRVARPVPMSRDTKSYPRRTGGLTAYAIGEISAPTETTMTVDQIQLVAKKFGVLTYYSRDLDEDAALSVGNLIMEEAALAFANKEDECGFNGTGASTYNGIVGIKESLAAGSKYTAITGNTSFGTLDLEDFEGMIAKLPSYAFRDGGPSWYIHRSGWALSMLRLAAAAGGNTTRELAAGASEVQFLGYPVVFVEVMNNTTTAQTSTDGLVYFGNIRQGVDFGDRRGVTMDMSREVAFTTQQIAVLGTERFDIKVHDAGNANNAGAIVMLSTPSS